METPFPATILVHELILAGSRTLILHLLHGTQFTRNTHLNAIPAATGALTGALRVSI